MSKYAYKMTFFVCGLALSQLGFAQNAYELSLISPKLIEDYRACLVKKYDDKVTLNENQLSDQTLIFFDEIAQKCNLKAIRWLSPKQQIDDIELINDIRTQLQEDGRVQLTEELETRLYISGQMGIINVYRLDGKMTSSRPFVSSAASCQHLVTLINSRVGQIKSQAYTRDRIKVLRQQIRDLQSLKVEKECTQYGDQKNYGMPIEGHVR